MIDSISALKSGTYLSFDEKQIGTKFSVKTGLIFSIISTSATILTKTKKYGKYIDKYSQKNIKKLQK